MDVPGSSYLYALASLSMTFSGFCAIVIVLRQTAGEEMSGWHFILTRLFIECGLWASAFCMVPLLLALCGLPLPMVWRLSSALIAAVMLAYGVTYPNRRRSVVDEPLPLQRWVAIVIVSGLIIASLVANAIGLPYKPGVAPVAVAATWTLACGAAIFVAALNAFWQRNDDK
jgi:hypothetical protein